MAAKPTPEQIGALVEIALRDFTSEQVAAIIEGRFMITPRPSKPMAEDLKRTVARPGHVVPLAWTMYPPEYQLKILARALSRFTHLNMPTEDMIRQQATPIPFGAAGLATGPWISRLSDAKATRPEAKYLQAVGRLLDILREFGILARGDERSNDLPICTPDPRMVEFHRACEFEARHDIVVFPVWVQSAAVPSPINVPNLRPLDAYSVGFILFTHWYALKSMPGFIVSTSDRYGGPDGDEGFANWKWDRGTLELVPSRASQAHDSRVLTFFVQQP